ncbi:MAG: hypothetical protein AAB229_03820, partial [Candidatus Hydrogenedentota bacterium]
AANLPPEFLKKWNALRSAKVTHPVTYVDAEACVRCRSELKPNSQSKLHAGQAVICDQCKRILVPA